MRSSPADLQDLVFDLQASLPRGQGNGPPRPAKNIVFCDDIISWVSHGIEGNAALTLSRRVRSQ